MMMVNNLLSAAQLSADEMAANLPKMRDAFERVKLRNRVFKISSVVELQELVAQGAELGGKDSQENTRTDSKAHAMID